MSLQFVFGRAGSGKSEYCINQALRAEEQGKRVIMIVPEQYSHHGEGAFLQKKGYIHDDFNVTSFNRLARKLIENAGIKHETIDNSGRAMLIWRAVNNCKKKLAYYQTAAERRGYISLFMDALSEFKKGQITPEALRAAAERTDGQLFAARLKDLSYIYEEYNKLLSEDLFDGDDDLTLMASLCFDSEYIKNALIFIDEFHRFTQNELSCIGAFLAVGARVTVTLCMPGGFIPENSVFKNVRTTKNVLEGIARDNGAAVDPPVILECTPRFLSQELSVLEKALSGEKADWMNQNNDISLYIAKSRYEEVVRAAAKIRTYVAETDACYKDVAVITGDYEGYADLIQSIFPMYEIPVFADTRHDFLNHPIVLYLFSLFDLLSGISTQRVVSYMKSGFAGITEDEAFRLENYALAAAIEYGDWLDDDRFLRKAKNVFDPEEEKNADSTDQLEVKNRLLSPVLQLKSKLSEAKYVRSRVIALKDFFNAVHLTEKIDGCITHFQKEGLVRQADEFSEVYDILIETLDMMVFTMGDAPTGLSAMRSILEAGLSQKSIGVIPSVYDQVSYGDLNRSVIKNVRALFIIGANDGIFPPTPSSGSLLSDSEREFLLSQGISVAPDTKKRIADAEFSIYSAACIACEKIFVSYAVTDDNGGGMRPSFFVSKLKRTFPNIKVSHELNLDEQPPEISIASRQSAYTYVLTHIKELSKNEIANKLFHVLSCDPEYQTKLERAAAFSSYCNHAGKLDKNTVNDLYGSKLYGSVSRFERYSACPFSFFLEYGLKAKERTVLKVGAPDIGSLLHTIIERFSEKLKGKKLTFRTISQEEQKRFTDEIIEDMFSTIFIKNIYSTGRLEALKKRLKSLVSKSIWAICAHVARGEFEPSDFEVTFDKNGTLPPVTVSLPTGAEITMTGRIDRIDTFSHGGNLYLKIIDYKSGSKGYSLADIFNGTTLQLAVYMLAATEGYKKNSESEPRFGGMFYFRLDDPVSDSTPEYGADENEVLKTFKMSGLAPEDPAVIRAIDSKAQGWSAVIPVYVKSDGSVSKSQSKTAGAKEFDKLKQYIKHTLAKIGQEILNGDVDIRPIKNGKTLPCSYCKFVSVCGFDPNIHPCRKATEFQSDDEIWEKISE